MTLFDPSDAPDDGGRPEPKRNVLIVETDGGSRGNPGHAGYGALVRDPASGAILAEKAEYLGIVSNNVAEYSGLVAGLQLALAQDPEALIHVKMDSKLVVEQMSGRWKIKHEDMRALATKARSIVDPRRVRYEWIPRERNIDADRLSNEAMDAGQAGIPWQPAAGSVSVAGGGGAVSGANGGSPVDDDVEPEITPAPSTTPMPIIVERDPEPSATVDGSAPADAIEARVSGEDSVPAADSLPATGSFPASNSFPAPDEIIQAAAAHPRQPGFAPQPPASEAAAPTGRLHHIELWVENFAEARSSLGWMFSRLGFERRDEWDSGASWQGAVGYIVLESGPDVLPGTHERRRPGLNHLAFWAGPTATVDAIVADAPTHGWTLMFADRHPYAGGSGHYAAYLENAAGFEVELVVTTTVA